MAWLGAGILPWPGQFSPKYLSRLQRPVGIAKHLSRQEHHISLLPGDDLLGLVGLDNQSDGAGRNPHFLRDCLGSPSLVGCVLAGNRIWFHVGDYGSASTAKLENCVISFNEKHGVSIKGSAASFWSCTISRNGGWGIYGEYYASPAIKSSIITGNREGGLFCKHYQCKVSAEGSVLVGNAEVDVRNESSLLWDLRGNYWGPVITAAARKLGSGITLPNVVGKAQVDGFLTEMPKSCGATLTELAGQKLW